jgi:carbonic anhydrase/acetyltransferase-like protein (isoleucine patch superfamily)
MFDGVVSRNATHRTRGQRTALADRGGTTMLIEHGGAQPNVDASAYVAPNAVVSGAVSIGPNCSVLFGATITADGGPVDIGSDCVIMEQSVIRGTPRHPTRLGNRVLVGPHAHLTGCAIADDVFIATGAAVFNGATIDSRSEVRINGVVHVNSVVPPETTVPIGWVAVGDPVQLLPASEHDAIWQLQREMDFPGTVFGVRRSVPRGDRIQRYARALRRHHEGDVVL